MTQSVRKLVGTLLMLVLLVIYPLVAMAVYAGYLSGAPWWIAVGYALVVGLFWAVPAAMVIRWMSRA
jgi:hypothetical protein